MQTWWAEERLKNIQNLTVLKLLTGSVDMQPNIASSRFEK